MTRKKRFFVKRYAFYVFPVQKPPEGDNTAEMRVGIRERSAFVSPFGNGHFGEECAGGKRTSNPINVFAASARARIDGCGAARWIALQPSTLLAHSMYVPESATI